MRENLFQKHLTFSTLASPNWILSQIVDNAVDNAINGVDFRGIGAELDITRLKEFNDDLPQTLMLLQRHDLQMPCLNTSVVLVTPEPSKWELMQDELRRYAQLAQRSGTRFIRLFGGQIPNGMKRYDATSLARSHLFQAVEICRPMHCRPLLETHDAWTVSSAVLELLTGFDPAEAGVLWDLEHPWRGGESPAATSKALKNWVQHVHIKDTIRQGGNSVPTLLGEGEIPLQDCLQQLASISYAGWICLETEKRWHPEGPEPEQSIPQFARYMRAISD